MQKIIEELKLADATLDADGYKAWSYVRLAIAQAIEALQSQNSGKPLVSGSLPSDERIFFADYIQRCVIDRGAMTYPSLKDAITAWDETKDRFGGNDR